ncbi:glycosyltransferase [Larkinella soli]|uniref:glycosyltransferase n=1 Tax=Larkinella soli TaxID=1770527 RepID=UPI000FFCBA18|nr:glycosyltransferase [Larkinella soli]
MKKQKFLFACMPFEGHFNPLTALAVHLKSLGHDVRWYAGAGFADGLNRLGIRHYPFLKAVELNQKNLEKLLPERSKHKGKLAKLKFDIKHAFLARVPEFVADLDEIREDFPFDILVSDCAFGASPIARKRYGVLSVVIGVMPLMQTSCDLAPTGLGLTPSRHFPGRVMQAVLRWVNKNIIFRESTEYANRIMESFGLPPFEVSIFDALVQDADLYLQSGTPGFEYQRSDLGRNIRFVGPMLPHQNGAKHPFRHIEKLKKHCKVILATQGTVERDPGKILVPTLEAFRNTEYLVVATTGGSQTAELRARFPEPNVIIEDFIDFNSIMPHADVYVTNAGYGGVMLSILNELPMVTAGVHEGKNEIAARVGYFKLGVNLNTERPTAAQIRRSVEQVLADKQYRKNMVAMSEEFRKYNAGLLCEQYIAELVESRRMPQPEAEITF